MESSNNPLRQQVEALKKSGLSAREVVKNLSNPTAKKTVTPSYSAKAVADALMSAFTGLTPLELATLLKLYKNDPVFVAQGVIAPDGFPDMTATALGSLLLNPTLFPSLSKTDMYNTLTAAGFSATDATTAVNTLFPSPGYALNVSGTNSFMAAPANPAYNFGTGDFTLQCWVKTTASGTVISRKGGPGGPGNGGFLLVLKADGVVKLATDNGFGFYEVNTNSPTVMRDGNWHFLTAIRQSGQLSINIDGNPVPAAPRSNIAPPLNINNNLSLMMGSTEQWQETFRQFTGQLDEVRIWNRALQASEITANMNKQLTGNEQGLVGYYTFENQNGNDRSVTQNTANPTGSISFVSPGALG